MRRRGVLAAAFALSLVAAACSSDDEQSAVTTAVAPAVIETPTTPTTEPLNPTTTRTDASGDTPGTAETDATTDADASGDTDSPGDTDGTTDTDAPETDAAADSDGTTDTDAPETDAAADSDGTTDTGPPDTEVADAPTTGAGGSAGPLTVDELLALGRPIVLAHGGGEDEFPHSTPFAFGRSVEAGVDMLDFDVQLTADGVLVVQHDDDTGRTANADLVIADTEYADLAKLDNAYWFTPQCTCTGQPEADYIYRGIRTGETPPPAGHTASDFAIPRFEDIVERFPDMPVNIEIKGEGAPAIAAAYELARILTDHDLIDNAVVASFDDTVVDAFHELAPDIEISPGLGASSAFILGGTPLPHGMRILQLPPKFGDIDVLSEANIAAAHAAGYVIWVWPNNRFYENAPGYASLLLGGMDGLNINFPATGVRAVEEFLARR